MRLIDADALGLDINRKAHENFPANRNLTLYAESLLAHAPTIDAVPVVRCKDCKHYKPPKVSAHYVNHTQYCTRVVTMKVSPDSFCSYGERKDGE